MPILIKIKKQVRRTIKGKTRGAEIIKGKHRLNSWKRMEGDLGGKIKITKTKTKHRWLKRTQRNHPGGMRERILKKYTIGKVV